MSQSTFNVVTLAKRPTDTIIPGETLKLESRPMLHAADVKEGELLIEAIYLSLDPAMRGWMNDTRSYVPPVQIGEIMRGAVIAKVLVSKAEGFKEADYVSCASGWKEYAVINAKEASLIDVPANGRVTDTLGVVGFTGMTAYFGLLDIGQVKAGDFVVVSGAAGATGSVVCQIAKLKGARVLGIAGSDDKVAWLKELGCDDAINYKSPDFKTEFKAKTKDLIDVFFDNVGGELLDLALTQAKQHARFVICGAISNYNTSSPYGLTNMGRVIGMRIRLEGFIVFDYASRFAEARKALAGWLAEGKLQRKETIVKGGLQAAEQGLVDLYKGINTGKLLVEVKADESVSKL